jgi:hypothetical protein
MSVYFLMWGGTTPIGSLFAGSLANRFGPALAYVISGAVTAAGVVFALFLQRQAARRIAAQLAARAGQPQEP